MKDMDKYQEVAFSFAVDEAKDLRYLTMGLAGEAGEVANVVKKIYRNRYGEMDTDSRQRIMDELGDVLWYVAGLASILGMDLSDVAEYNIRKLTERKQNGDIRHA